MPQHCSSSFSSSDGKRHAKALSDKDEKKRKDGPLAYSAHPRVEHEVMLEGVLLQWWGLVMSTVHLATHL